MNARRRTVLHVSQPTDAGVARCVAGLAADQVRRGWSVAVACPPEGGLPETVRAMGAAHVGWPAGRSPGAATFLETLRLRRIVQTFRPDLVHLHSSKAGLAGRLALRGRLPTVFQPNAWSWEAARGPVEAASRGWERLAGRWADVIVCVSEAELDAGRSAGIRSRCEVVYNGIELSAFPMASDEDRRAARAALGLAEGPHAVCVGRLSRQKGQDLLLQAWDRVRTALPAARLTLVGEGPARESLERRASAAVRFAGWSDEVPSWLAAADVVVQPSRWEGMSYTVIEAMARGRSVVATDVAGNRELLGGEAGAIVPVEDARSLADAVVERLSDPARAAAEGRAGRARAERSHDLDATAQAIADLYAEILGRS